jgi:transposase, IS5 family
MHGFSIFQSEKHADMIKYISNRQLMIEEFKSPFQVNLDKENRWVKLGNALPWDSLASIYHRSLSADMGAPSIDARIVIGALIIKHKLKLDDREAIETIRENMYMQYFLGLSEYTYEDIFDRSLFTILRYRLGTDKFDAMTRQLILLSEGKKEAAKTDIEPYEEGNDTNAPYTQPGTKEEVRTQKPKSNKGKLLMDATVADQMIAYPTDLGLLSKSREESERLIDEMCQTLKIGAKPRTYRRKARKQYLNVAKKKSKSKNELHKAIGQQLRYLRRNIKSIHNILDRPGTAHFPLKNRDQRIFWVIQNIYGQQDRMYKSGTHSVENRIVNIYQPYVRPIVRGKDKAQVEFGSKLGVSIQNGFARINTLSWDAYNESSDLKKQVEDYKRLNGYYPKVVITDKIYGTQENRRWLKDRDIRYSGKPLGRPSTEQQTPYQKRKYRQEQGIRNQVEGKFGQGKNGYNLNKIRARAAKTSESWIACIFFVMNLVKFSKVFLSSIILNFFEHVFENKNRILRPVFLSAA